MSTVVFEVPINPNREANEISRWFPCSEEVASKKGAQVWEIIVEPWPPLDELDNVIADLLADSTVDIEAGGRLRHAQGCRTTHDDRRSGLNFRPGNSAYRVEVAKTTGVSHPAFRVVEPEFSKRTMPTHPHFYGWDRACPITPEDGQWLAGRDTVAEYAQLSIPWLVRTEIWAEIYRRERRSWWPGAEVTHGLTRLSLQSPNNQCNCASGRLYGECCKKNVDSRLVKMRGDLRSDSCNTQLGLSSIMPPSFSNFIATLRRATTND